MIGIVVVQLVAAALTPASGNLTENPSFEIIADGEKVPSGWRGNTDTFSRDVTVAREGKASLKYGNANPEHYRLCRQPLPLKAGGKYRFSAQVKTDGINGDDSGATICVEWCDKQGKWLGGSYPSGVKGTCDWQLVEGFAAVPTNAGSSSLSCYVRRGMTGTAWFDDVRVQRMVGPPMRTVLLEPNYRGRVLAGEKQQARVRVWLNAEDHDLSQAETVLTSRLSGPVRWMRAGPSLLSHDLSKPIDVTVPLDALPPGEYSLELHLPDWKDGMPWITSYPLTIVDKKASPPRVFIDEHQRCIVDGKPFFPIGMYWSTVKEDNLELYTDSAFNCIMPYGRPTEAQMDLAHAHGIKVVYSIKDFYHGSRWCPGFIKSVAHEEIKVREYVRRFRDHPALLAWYLNDELPLSYITRLEAHQRWTVEEDPNHPTWVVLYQYRQVRDYINTFDIIGTDPYPIGRRPASEAGVWTAETRRQVCDARPLWQVPQLHNWINYKKGEENTSRYHTPTRDEVRSMAWQCICEGAMGLVFYSWRDIRRNPDVPFETQWAYLKEIAAEIDAAAPALLSVQPTPAIEISAQPANPRWLHTLVRRRGDTTFLVAVNNGDADGTIAVTLPEVWRNVRSRDNRSIEKTSDGFSDRLARLQVRIYEIAER